MFRLLLVTFVTGLVANASTAQTPPSVGEVANYDGFFAAAHTGNEEMIRQLVAAGANVNAQDLRGRATPHVAAFALEDEALRALAEAGADMNALEGQAYNVVTIAAVANDLELMTLAIKLGNDPGLTTSPYDGTALIAAAHLGHVEIVRRLIAADAPLDHMNNLHWNAVMEAVVLGDGGPDHLKVLDALLAAGADRSLVDRNGTTPLEQAEQRGFSEMADRLKKED